MKFTRQPSRAGNVILLSFFGWLVAAGVHAAAPDFRWAQRAGGFAREYGTDIGLDPAGNSHVLGRFTSTNLVFGSTTLTNGGLFLATYDAAGNVMWARQIGTTIDLDRFGGQSADCRIAVDGGGNTFVGGWFRPPGTITFESVTITNDTANNPDFFLAKYDAAGNFVWARKAGSDGTPNSIRALALTADSAGNCYLTGDYVDAPSLGLTNQSGFLGWFTAKFGGDGSLIWSRPMARVQSAYYTRAIATDSQGGYFVAGALSDSTVTFDNITLTNPSSITFDVYTVRYNSAGTLMWAKRCGSVGTDYLEGLAVDAAGNCFLSMYTASATIFDNFQVTNGGYCLAKYDPNGNGLWCRNTSTNASTLRSATDALGNSYVLGYFLGLATFDGLTLTNNGSAMYPSIFHPPNFLAKFDPAGRTLWAKQFGGGDTEYDYSVKGGLAVDAAGNCRITGFIHITNAVFDSFVLGVLGTDEDAYVAGLDAEPPRLELARAGNALILAWPTNQPNFGLEFATGLDQPNGWSPVTNATTLVGFQNFVTNLITTDPRYYRLRKE